MLRNIHMPSYGEIRPQRLPILNYLYFIQLYKSINCAFVTVSNVFILKVVSIIAFLCILS